VGSPILQPCSFALPGLCYPKLPPLRTAGSLWDKPLRPGIHRHLWHLCQATPPRPAQPCTISAGPYTQDLHSPAGAPFHWAVPRNPARVCFASHIPKPCTAMQELRFTGLCPPALHNLCFASHTPKACTALQDLCSAGSCPKARCTGDTNRHDFYLAGPCPQGRHSTAGAPFR
jgi:hypothetical protein